MLNLSCSSLCCFLMQSQPFPLLLKPYTIQDRGSCQAVYSNHAHVVWYHAGFDDKGKRNRRRNVAEIIPGPDVEGILAIRKDIHILFFGPATTTPDHSLSKPAS